MTRHFIQYWNFAQVDLEQKGRYNVLQVLDEAEEEDEEEEKGET